MFARGPACLREHKCAQYMVVHWRASVRVVGMHAELSAFTCASIDCRALSFFAPIP